MVDGENLLPEGKPDLSKLELYQELRVPITIDNIAQPYPLSKWG